MTRPDFTDATWRKSRQSGDAGCVEVARVPGWAGVRDTKQKGTGPVLAFSEDSWMAFLDAVRSGEFETPQAN